MFDRWFVEEGYAGEGDSKRACSILIYALESKQELGFLGTQSGTFSSVNKPPIIGCQRVGSIQHLASDFGEHFLPEGDRFGIKKARVSHPGPSASYSSSGSAGGMSLRTHWARPRCRDFRYPPPC